MILAKTNPVESLAQHTKQLLDRYDDLKLYYGTEIKNENVWRLLYLAAKYHDLGKSYTHFQKRLRKSLGQKVSPTSLVHIPHNYLSPFFLPLRQLRLNKHHRRVLVDAIAYHHEREQSIDPQFVREIAEQDLVQHFESIKEDFKNVDLSIQLPKQVNTFNYIESDLSRRRYKFDVNDENYLLYVLVKGLLHRLDHAASAYVNIEIDPDICLTHLTKQYLQQLTNKEENYLRSLQEYTLKHQDKNLVLVAQTGMGKTEAALLWAGKKKTFFTVPLRVSLNALFDRVSKKMGYENAGLLHSTSVHHLDETGMENWEVIHDHSRQLANKLTFTTIDQIMKFPFKFRGYEKFYATLAYSAIIIDEIQAYSPWIVAVIIKALKMIKKIGGRFLIMTATLPEIYLETMRAKNIIDQNTEIKYFYNDDILRHRYKVKNKSVLTAIDQILESAQSKKVLVIVNTIDQAIQLYEKIIEQDPMIYTKLFHSRFIQMDRQLLEAALLSFNDRRDKSGIWITTQIVEASIDIDFDILFTELAPLDSLFQRCGRCNRQRELTTNTENILIYTEEVSGYGTVYDKDIVNFSKEILQKYYQESGKNLYESTKLNMVQDLYSVKRLKGTNYYKEFKKALNQLNIEDYTLSHQEAQQQLRGTNTVTIIPRNIYDEQIDLFMQLENEIDKKKRSELRRKIEQYTCSVNKYVFRNDLQPIDFYYQTKSGKYPVINYVYVLDCPYDFNQDKIEGKGLLKEEEFDVFW